MLSRNVILVSALLVNLPGLAAQPNVLFIYADDLGYGDLSGYGHPVIQTPNIDALAEEGVSLSNY